MNHARTVMENPMSSAAPAPVPAPADAPGGGPVVAAHDNAWVYLATDRRARMALGGMALFAVAVGGAMGAGLHRSPLVPAVFMAAMAVSVARAGWGWLRGRARLRESVLSHVEEYGGGVYGTGAGITLLVLSARTLPAEWAQAGGPMDFLRGMTLEFWIGFSGDSIRNAIQAGIWPLHWYAEHGLAAAVAVGVAAWAGDALADAWRRREPLVVDESVPATEGTEAPAGERLLSI
jgi:hypothetical protein